MGESGGLGRSPVVGAAPGREFHATALAGRASPGEVVDQPRDRLARQRPVEELRLGEAVAAAGRLPARRRRVLVGGTAEAPLVVDGLAVGQLAAVVRQRFGTDARREV